MVTATATAGLDRVYTRINKCWRSEKKVIVQKRLVFGVLVAVLGAIVGAFGYAELSSEAGAAPPPPQTQPVREQNLDGSGLIRVHEQGTANVNVVSLPAPPPGRLIDLGTVQPSATGTAEFAVADISECERISVLITVGDQSASPNTDFRGSADGSVFVGLPLGTVAAGGELKSAFDGKATIIVYDAPASVAFLQVRLRSLPTPPPPVDVTAQIWCKP